MDDIENEPNALGGVRLVVDIKKESFGNEPIIDAFSVVVTNTNFDGVFMNRYSRERLVPFLRGITVASSLMGFSVDIPDIP